MGKESQTNRSGPPSFLWICHRSDFDEDHYIDSSSARQQSAMETLGQRLDILAKNQQETGKQLERVQHSLLTVVNNLNTVRERDEMVAMPSLSRSYSDSRVLRRIDSTISAE